MEAQITSTRHISVFTLIQEVFLFTGAVWYYFLVMPGFHVTSRHLLMCSKIVMPSECAPAINIIVVEAAVYLLI